MLSPHQVQQTLGMPDEAMARLARLRRLDGVPGPMLPDTADAERLLVRLGAGAADRAEALAAQPDPATHPAHWWVLERVYHDICANMGVPVPIEGFSAYPALPVSTGALGRHLPVWTYLALVPAIRRFHHARGIPENLSWDNLGLELVAALTSHHAMTGHRGIGLWGFGWSLPLRYRGADYRLGRLEYNLGALSLGNGACGYVLGVHIPSGPSLDATECDTSFAQARHFFVKHFPDRPITFFTCRSWLLDPQLAEYLDPASNLVRFQRRFTPVPLGEGEREGHICNDDWSRYVFRRSWDASRPLAGQLDDLSQDTTLRRAFVAHLRAGKHWYARTGWMPFAG